jgi:hypothetical protein
MSVVPPLLFAPTMFTAADAKTNGKNLPAGMVGCFMWEKDGPFGLFVVVASDGDEVTVVQPRIKVTGDLVEIGQDLCTPEQQAAVLNIRCLCEDCAHYPEQMPAGQTECEKANLKAFHDTFEAAAAPAVYITHKFQMPADDVEPYVCWLSKSAFKGEDYK